MELEKVATKTLRALIYDQLRERIMSGEIRPGQELSLRSLAEKLGVSLMPVREAVWQLESDKILAVRSNRNIVVNTLTPEEMQEALRLRIILETEAITRACERWEGDGVLGELEKLVVEMRSPKCDARTYVDLNKQYHYRLYSYAASPLLLDLIDRLWVRITPYFYLHITKNEDLAHTPAGHYHQEIFESFARRDAAGAAAALRHDIDDPARRMIEEMRKNEVTEASKEN